MTFFVLGRDDSCADGSSDERAVAELPDEFSSATGKLKESNALIFFSIDR